MSQPMPPADQSVVQYQDVLQIAMTSPLQVDVARGLLRQFYDAIGIGIAARSIGVIPVTLILVGGILVTGISLVGVKRFIPSFGSSSDSSQESDGDPLVDDELVDQAIENLRHQGIEPDGAKIRKEISEIKAGEGQETDEINMQLLQDAEEKEISDTMSVAPSSVENPDDANDYIIRNGEYVRAYIVNSYPSRVQEGWLDGLLTDPADIRVSMHIDPRAADDIMDRFDKKQARNKASLKNKREDGRVNIDQEKTALKHLKRMKSGVLDGQLTIYDFALYIEAIAPDVDTLDDISGRIEHQFQQKKGDVKPFIGRQIEAQRSIAPLCDDAVGNSVLFDTQALKTTFPFIEPTIKQDYGVLLGFHDVTGLPIIANRYNGSGFSGNNMLVSGVVGSGKSYFAKLISWRWAMTAPDMELLIIDPAGGETGFKSPVENMGGERITISGANRINPLEINPPEDDNKGGGSNYEQKINSVLGILKSTYSTEMSQQEQSILVRAIRFAYLEKGITPEPETHRNENPTIDDVLDKLEKMANGERPTEFLDVDEDNKGYIRSIQMTDDSEEIDGFESEDKSGFVQRNREKEADMAWSVFIGLEDFQQGGQASFLNGKSTVDIDSRIVQFDISDAIDKADESLVMQVVLDWLWQRCKGDRVRNQVVLDEAHYMLRNDYAKQSLELFIRHARHYNAGLTLISQTVAEFLKNDAKAIYKQCSIRVLMRHQHLDAEEAKGLEITEDQRQFILNAQVGEGNDYSRCLMQLGDFGDVQARVMSNEYEHCAIDDGVSIWGFLYENNVLNWRDIPKRKKQAAYEHLGNEIQNYLDQQYENPRMSAKPLAGSQERNDNANNPTSADD